MVEPASRVILVLNGRVQEVPVSRPSAIEGPAAWWKSLALLGATLLALGVWLGAGLGAVAASGGVALFLAAGVAVGSERFGVATAFGAGGVVWTSAGIAVYLGTDAWLGISALAFATVGVAATVAGSLGALRVRAREPDLPSAG